MAFDETSYDKELMKAVREWVACMHRRLRSYSFGSLSATVSEDHSLQAASAEAECREKIKALREEQKYNQSVLETLEAQWLAIEKLNDAAKKRAEVLQVQLTKSENILHELRTQAADD